MNDYSPFGSGFNKFSPVAPTRDQATIDAVNQSRVKAWNQVMYALGTVAIVGIIPTFFIASQATFWTIAFMLPIAWLLFSLQKLRASNKEIIRLEEIYGVALKTEIPTVPKAVITVAAPVALIAGFSVLTTFASNYSGSNVAGDSSISTEDFTNNDVAPDPVVTQYEPAAPVVPTPEPYTEEPAAVDEPPRIVRTVDLTDAEFEDSGFDYALGVDIWVPYSCTDLILYWHTEDDAGNYYYDYSNSYSSLSPGTVNEFYMGTNSPISDEETYFATDSVECV